MVIYSFVDWDMLMRHFGHGVGHLQYQTQRQQDLDTDLASRTVDADLALDEVTDHEQEHDIELDIEEEGELEGEIESDVKCASATGCQNNSDQPEHQSQCSDVVLSSGLQLPVFTCTVFHTDAL
jgi:hypothetical protein